MREEVDERDLKKREETNQLVLRVLRKATDEILTRNISDNQDAFEIIEEIALESQEDLDVDEMIFLVNRVYGKLRGQLGPLTYLLDEDSVNEIMVNGPDWVYIEKNGFLEKIDDGFDSKEELEQIIRRIAASVRREINEMNPILDARLKDGSRVNAVLRNISLDGPTLTIRKFRRRKITMEEMIKSGSLPAEAAMMLKDLVASGYNIFVSGGTSTGKTTFLNALSDYIPGHERVITIEDSAELQMDGIENLIRMECRLANSSGTGQIPMDALIRSSLRMRPDRIIVGEVRGREVSDMLQALNTGHSGMSTGHGNSVKGMLRRLEAMYITGVDMPMDAIRAQIVEGIDIIIQLMRRGDGSRFVAEISEICGFDGKEYEINCLYKLDDHSRLIFTGNSMRNDIKLKMRANFESKEV